MLLSKILKMTMSNSQPKSKALIFQGFLNAANVPGFALFGTMLGFSVLAKEAGSSIKIMKSIKNSFDPQGILNPGKAIPSLARCAELNGVHVHNGVLSFPDLERF